MSHESEQNKGLQNTVVRICPACGVVNPSGPSEACSHLQLVRFKGIDESLQLQLEKLATVRNEFWSLVSQLRNTVMHAAHQGLAEVEITHKGRVSEVDNLRKRPAASPLILSNPEPARPPQTTTKRKQKKTPTSKKVDPRQLALIAREPPQGDA